MIAAGVVAGALVLGVVGTTAGMVWALQQKHRAESADEATRLELTRSSPRTDEVRSLLHPHWSSPPVPVQGMLSELTRVLAAVRNGDLARACRPGRRGNRQQVRADPWTVAHGASRAEPSQAERYVENISRRNTGIALVSARKSPGGINAEPRPAPSDRGNGTTQNQQIGERCRQPATAGHERKRGLTVSILLVVPSVLRGEGGRFVVGVDRSHQALVAARQAADIAKALGAELHIVTAVMKNDVHQVGIGSDHAVLSDVDLAEQDLHAIAAEFRGSIAVSTKAVRSNPAEALCSEADRLQASMNVIGNKRVQGVARVLGSVAGTVAKEAPCDVHTQRPVQGQSQLRRASSARSALRDP